MEVLLQDYQSDCISLTLVGVLKWQLDLWTNKSNLLLFSKKASKRTKKFHCSNRILLSEAADTHQERKCVCQVILKSQKLDSVQQTGWFTLSLWIWTHSYFDHYCFCINKPWKVRKATNICKSYIWLKIHNLCAVGIKMYIWK